MQISELTFSVGELASYVTLVERVCEIAHRRKNDGQFEDHNRFIVR